MNNYLTLSAQVLLASIMLGEAKCSASYAPAHIYSAQKYLKVSAQQRKARKAKALGKRGGEPMPAAPAGDCATNLDGYNYDSPDEVCNETWQEWDSWCWNDASSEADWALCEASEEVLNRALYPKVDAPAGDCATDAEGFYYVSADEVCNKTWREWDGYCWYVASSEADLAECENSFVAL